MIWLLSYYCLHRDKKRKFWNLREEVPMLQNNFISKFEVSTFEFTPNEVLAFEKKANSFQSYISLYSLSKDQVYSSLFAKSIPKLKSRIGKVFCSWVFSNIWQNLIYPDNISTVLKSISIFIENFYIIVIYFYSEQRERFIVWSSNHYLQKPLKFWIVWCKFFKA